MISIGFASAASGQSFENDFGFELTNDENELIYSIDYSYPGFSTKYTHREIWSPRGEFESVLTVISGNDDLGYQQSIIHYKKDGSYSARIDTRDSPDINENLVESSQEAIVVELGVPYSYYEIVTHKQRGEGIPYGSTRTDYKKTPIGIDLIDTVFGRLPALRVIVEETINRDGNYVVPGSFYSKYTDWVIPGIGEVNGFLSDPETGELITYELTETDLDFEPKPLPILDSDNAVWNMFGYTWDMSGGWQESFEFGSLWADQFPWVWSDDMQSWLYVQGDRHSIWAWVDRTATWIWTNRELYPWVYDSVMLQWQPIIDEG